MSTRDERATAVRDAPDYQAIERTMKRFKFKKDALLEVLNAAQEAYGYLSKELLLHVSEQLSVPFAQVYGVATFYHMFTFEPLGEHNCIVCTGTACYVKGADRIAQTVADAFDIQPGETTTDGVFSLTMARCIGSCGLAPVVLLDGGVRGKASSETIIHHINEIISQASGEPAS